MDKVSLPDRESVISALRGPGFVFNSFRFVQFPKSGEVLRVYNTQDYSVGAALSDRPQNDGSGVRTMTEEEFADALRERRRQNLNRSRRAMRWAVRGIGRTVQLLTLTTRDVFPWGERFRFARAVKHFIDNSRHIIGAYVVTAELTKREFCHAHLSIPDKTAAPAGHYSGYTVAELSELRELWRFAVDKFAPPDFVQRRLGARGNIHVTTSRQAIGISTYMAKSASSYMLKEDRKDVFFSHRFRSSRGLVRVLPWHQCERAVRPRADFASGECEHYMFSFAEPDDQRGSYCSAIYALFPPDP